MSTINDDEWTSEARAAVVTLRRTADALESVLTAKDAGAGWAEGGPVQPREWVCDGCMRTVGRSQIAEMADGEHVLCHRCSPIGDPR